MRTRLWNGKFQTLRKSYFSRDHIEIEIIYMFQVRNIIHERRDAGRPVAGMIIEPVQAEGGDRSASDEFYRQLRNLALEENVSLTYLK